MESISLEEFLGDKPELLKTAKGLFEFIHFVKLPSAQDKVNTIAEKLKFMTGIVGSLTEMYGGDFEEVEMQFGEKADRFKVSHALIDDKLLENLLFSDIEIVLIQMWKELHVNDTVDISVLEENRIAYEKAWSPLCTVLIERTEGAHAAIRLKEEVSDCLNSLMFVFYANKITQDFTDFACRREKIKNTLREITSELIKVEAKKPKPKAKTLKPKKTGLKGPKTAFMKKQVDVFAAYVKDHPITASVKAGQRARACWLAHKKEWDEAAEIGKGYTEPKSLARAYQNRRS